MKKVLTCVISLLLFATLQSYAAVYYVDASYGNDNNNGQSQGSAWKTIDKVNSHTFYPGDSILFKRGGDWNGDCLEIKWSGSSVNPLTVGAYGSGNKPIISGLKKTASSSWNYYSTVGSLNVYRYSPSPSYTILTVLQGSTYLEYRVWDGSVQATFSGASLGSWSRTGNTVYVVTTGNIDPDNYSMLVGASDSWPNYSCCWVYNDVKHVTIRDIEFRGANRQGVRVRNWGSVNCTNVTLQNLTVRYCGGTGISVSNDTGGNYYYVSNITVQNCEVSYNGYHGIGFIGYVRDSLVRYNKVHHNGWSREDGVDEYGGHGITSYGGSPSLAPHNNVIEHNEVSYQYAERNTDEGAGIQCDNSTQSAIVRYNYCHHNEGAGILVHLSDNCKVYYNLLQVNCTNEDEYSGALSIYNAYNTDVFNNICYGNKKCGIFVSGPSDYGTDVKNNIVSENGTFEIRVLENSGHNLTCDYNCVYHSAGGNFMRWYYTNYNWYSWKTATGKDSHSINSNPRFVNAAYNDFSLQSTSPCIDVGTSVGLTRDYIGNPVPSGVRVDIGAYEFVSAGSAGDDLLGTWDASGVFIRNSYNGSWICLGPPANVVTAGDLKGDSIDLLGVWSDGVWCRYSSSGTWVKFASVIPADISSGDMNGDGIDDLLGTWSSGVYYRDSQSGIWVRLAPFAYKVAAGDIDGDNTDDLVGIWDSGVFVRRSSDGTWLHISSRAVRASDIASGDMNGDGRDDVLCNWDDHGVYFKDTINGNWVWMMSVPADMIAAGDINIDGVDDLLIVASDGLWVKYSVASFWEKLSGLLPKAIDAGKMRDEIVNTLNTGEYGSSIPAEVENVKGPGNLNDFLDFSDSGPSGWNFFYEEQENTTPSDKNFFRPGRIPGPGEAGFRCLKQRNLIPPEWIE